MRRLQGLILALCFSVALLAAQGCATQTPAGGSTTQPAAPDATQQYTLANQTFTTVVTVLTDLNSAGVFAQGDWTNILTGINTASAALDAWGANLNSPAASQAAFNAAVPGLLKFVALGTAAKKSSPPAKPG